jgi:hypothetical protein
MQIVDLKYSATHPELFIAYSVMLAVSTIVSAVNIVVRLAWGGGGESTTTVVHVVRNILVSLGISVSVFCRV